MHALASGGGMSPFNVGWRYVPAKAKGVDAVKVKPSVKPICEKCKIIKRHGKVMVICENPKHKQRQG